MLNRPSKKERNHKLSKMEAVGRKRTLGWSNLYRLLKSLPLHVVPGMRMMKITFRHLAKSLERLQSPREILQSKQV